MVVLQDGIIRTMEPCQIAPVLAVLLELQQPFLPAIAQDAQEDTYSLEAASVLTVNQDMLVPREQFQAISANRVVQVLMHTQIQAAKIVRLDILALI